MNKPSAEEKLPNFNRSHIGPKQWAIRFLEHGPFCHYCNTRLTLLDAVKEHLVPICRGGADEMSNIVPACDECNQMKAWRTADEFFRDRPMLLARRAVHRTIASPAVPILSREEALEPGLLKKVTSEREQVSWAWRNPA
jgi:5-methylcytosine-specific restriction endonuclease McrA